MSVTEGGIHVEFIELVAEVFDADPATVRDDDTPTTLGGWTSLKHMQLVATIEEVYGVRLSVPEIKSFTSVGAVRAVLAGKGVEVAA